MELLSLRAWAIVSLGVGDIFFISCCDKYYIDSHQDAYFLCTRSRHTEAQ
jgi:hypothetical protein